MNCYDHTNGECLKGEPCVACMAAPMRRVRAGGPPPPDMPVDFAPAEHANEERRDAIELAADLALFALLVIVVICVLAGAAGYWSAR